MVICATTRFYVGQERLNWYKRMKGTLRWGWPQNDLYLFHTHSMVDMSTVVKGVGVVMQYVLLTSSIARRVPNRRHQTNSQVPINNLNSIISHSHTSSSDGPYEPRRYQEDCESCRRGFGNVQKVRQCGDRNKGGVTDHLLWDKAERKGPTQAPLTT